MKIIGIQKTFYILLVIGTFFAFAQKSLAQIPNLIEVGQTNPLDVVITWQTMTSAPNWYRGALLPTRGSLVTLAVQALSAGKSASLAGKNIRWTINDIPMISANDKDSFSFNVEEFAAGDYDLTVKISDATRLLGEGKVTLPIVLPKVVISVPYPHGITPKEQTILQALAYFFNQKIERVNLEWNINDAEIPASSQLDGYVVVSFPAPAQDMPVVVKASNPNQKYETATSVTHIRTN